MKITFEASEMFSPISSAFSILTSGAEICVNDIQYDEVNGTIKISMKRKEVIEQTRKGCLSGWLQPPYISRKNWVDSTLIIRQVASMKMEVDDILVNECNSRFTLMMGTKMENNEIYFGSLEEASGKTLCNIYIQVNRYDLEFFDEQKKTTESETVLSELQR
jgi:hypothetical protein